VDKLTTYRSKRDASRTPEPVPAEQDPAPDKGNLTFVVQEHHARRLHWDFRLEKDGVLVSWALPKGVPDDPAINHLAVHTEDHPLEYGHFEGSIPKGEYGAGRVEIWDHGSYESEKWTEREIKVTLHGQRLHGGYVLFQTRGSDWMIHREKLPLTPVKPMLATPGKPGDIDAWALELKWDGVRAMAYIEGGRTTLISRTGKDITATYPELRSLGRGIKRALLDGEIVAFGADGWPDFEALQPRIHARNPAEAARRAAVTPVGYLAFDLLQIDGRPLTDWPYEARRDELEKLTPNDALQIPPRFSGPDFDAIMDTAQQHGLEGIVAKRKDSRYETGARTEYWRKIKNLRGQEVVIGGWKPGKGNREATLGSLLVGVYDGETLTYAGHVGTGFTDKTLRMLRGKLRTRKTSPFDEVPAEHGRVAVWTEPELVIEVAFDRWTRAGRMRAPVYKGLRDDKEPAEVVRET